jgi:hypothetical protein
MDPVCPSGWKSDQKEFAYWSDSSSSTSTSCSSSVNTSEDGDEDTSYGYYRLVQIRRTYKFILEEEELIE